MFDLQALNLVQVIAIVTAFALSASKLFNASLPFWKYCKYPLIQRGIPGAILVLGALPAALAQVTSWTDFGVALMGAVALALPGTHASLPLLPPEGESRITTPPPAPISKAPPFACLMLWLACLMLALTPGCALLDSKHPVPDSCITTAEGLRNAVIAVLTAPGDWEATLVALSAQYGWDAVLCAVQEIGSLTSAAPGAQPLVVSRAKEFLAEHGR
jgi:hypothetical protein